MRNCPVCNGNKRSGEWRSEFLVPDGWTLPSYLDWFMCSCGMIYADNADITQADYDRYYVERYGYGVEDPEQERRIHERARLIDTLTHSKDIRVVDFGGGESGLCALLKERGFNDLHTIGVGDTMPDNIDLLIAEHVLEHVYDMPEVMAKFANVKPGGLLIVDIPDSTAIAYNAPVQMPMLDYHQKHINHFALRDILRLMYSHGFEYLTSFQYSERYVSDLCIIFSKTAGSTYDIAKSTVKRNINERLEKLRALGDTPVIVYGFGDIAAHCFTRVMPNVVYFVDDDPAFKGATVRGIEVRQSVISSEPIVVICQSQKAVVLNRIKELGLENEVIVI